MHYVVVIMILIYNTTQHHQVKLTPPTMRVVPVNRNAKDTEIRAEPFEPFELLRYANETELSKDIWKLKRSGRPYNTTWSILKKAAPYASGRSRCNLCLQEKLLILKFRDKNLLNKRSKIFSKCVHQKQFLAGNVVCARESKYQQSSRARTVTSSSKEKPTVFKNNVSC